MLGPIVFLLLFHYTVPGVMSVDIPCAARQMEFGTVCVCNSSYCDTVTRPSPLATGSYYHYTTSQDSPGFTRTTGNFIVEDRVYDDNDDHIVFTVNPSIEHQEILGFGGSFTDSSGIVISNMSTEVQDKIMESYFGATGVEYNFGRVPIGGSDFSVRSYTYDDTPFDGDLTHFSLAEEDYKYKIPLIQKAMNITPREIKLIGCAWSSPSWMKTNGAASSGYLLSKYYSSWAKYHIKFLDGYATEGIKFWMITSGNEVFFPLIIQGSFGLNMIIMPMTHRQWVKDHMAPLLQSSNHSNVKFGLIDDMRPFINFWMSRFARYPDTYDLVAGVALHWYWDWISPSFVADDYHKKFPDKLILYTESSINVILFGGQPVELGSWRRGALYAFNIMQNINHWANAYIDWNLVLNTDGGPYISLPLDAAIIVNQTSGEFYKNPMFYTQGHFSKFIPPGSRRIDVQSNQNSSANVTQTGNNFDMKILLGLLTPSPEVSDNSSTPSPLPTFPPFPYIGVPQTVECLATKNPDNSSTVIVFNAKDVAVNVTIADVMAGNITVTMAAQSINSFVYWRNPS
ncbi:putative glucosylceramidase 4 [Homalodisca vitripennis]|uniref:putative glucosylceramidase 4 n=1 Tax=Homalodisca vitripennis TaxID=197043 RepID=UPI001EEA39C7|nr:putative glucosylceramidase 4 [Homalodisca vitripennis]